ncbi:hypothetical protein C0Q70_15272 [Pomacea canaliculata]|uniref:Uncharacterized protein n=1 Tax=Pomacea canaliculata TaxID=400727 RepID=A0A2T7NUG8_POMCA|nr:hypothetical protein C0Q70_15272 [Pomacea canaliculata]
MGLNKHRGQEAAGWARHRQGVCSGTSSVHAGEGRKEKDALLTEITWSSDADEDLTLSQASEPDPVQKKLTNTSRRTEETDFRFTLNRRIDIH